MWSTPTSAITILILIEWMVTRRFSKRFCTVSRFDCCFILNTMSAWMHKALKHVHTLVFHIEARNTFLFVNGFVANVKYGNIVYIPIPTTRFNTSPIWSECDTYYFHFLFHTRNVTNKKAIKNLQLQCGELFMGIETKVKEPQKILQIGIFLWIFFTVLFQFLLHIENFQIIKPAK